MSYESRRKKRRYKRLERSQRRAPETARRWFLTLAKKPGRFACCGDRFDRGAELVYRHEPMTTLCVRCASDDPEARRARPPPRWERAKRTPKG